MILAKIQNLLKHKVRLAVLLFLAVILGIALWSAVVQIYEAPHDISPEIEYLGKRDYGCFPFPLSFICLAPPSTEYYFATSLTQEELQKYFKNATYKKIDPLKTSDGGGSVSMPDGRELDYSFKELPFVTQDGTFTITYYDNKEAILANEGFKSSNKPYIISLAPDSYLLAHSAR